MEIEQIVRDNVSKTVHMSLATSANNKPWVCEVHFAYDEGLNLYFRSLKSRRHSQEIAANPNIAGNIVKQFALNEAVVGIYFEGTAKLLPAGEEQNEAFACLKERLGIGDEALEEAKREDGHQFYKISVENYYAFGRFGTDHGEKFQLKWPKS